MLISNRGHALIADFGYTYLASSSFSLGVSSGIGGTYNWMPPEALEMTGQVIMTIESDIWSFAMTALVCCHPISYLVQQFNFFRNYSHVKFLSRNAKTGLESPAEFWQDRRIIPVTN